MHAPNDRLRVYADEGPTPAGESSPPWLVPSPNASRRRIARFAGEFVPYPVFGGMEPSGEIAKRFVEVHERVVRLRAKLAQAEEELRGFTLTELRTALFMVFRGDKWEQDDGSPPPEHVPEHVRELVRQIRAKVAAGELG